jgi:diacylglycerol kinase family enzyme
VGHAEQIARKISSIKEDATIISVGGDGTLSEIINGIINFNNITIGCIPCGSGNDFVASTELRDKTHIETLKYILRGVSRKINFMNVNGHRVINVAGFGLDTDVLKKFYKMHMFSPKFRYKVATTIKTLTFR